MHNIKSVLCEKKLKHCFEFPREFSSPLIENANYNVKNIMINCSNTKKLRRLVFPNMKNVNQLNFSARFISISIIQIIIEKIQKNNITTIQFNEPQTPKFYTTLSEFFTSQNSLTKIKFNWNNPFELTQKDILNSIQFSKEVGTNIKTLDISVFKHTFHNAKNDFDIQSFIVHFKNITHIRMGIITNKDSNPSTIKQKSMICKKTSIADFLNAIKHKTNMEKLFIDSDMEDINNSQNLLCEIMFNNRESLLQFGINDMNSKKEFNVNTIQSMILEMLLMRRLYSVCPIMKDFEQAKMVNKSRLQKLLRSFFQISYNEDSIVNDNSTDKMTCVRVVSKKIQSLFPFFQHIKHQMDTNQRCLTSEYCDYFIQEINKLNIDILTTHEIILLFMVLNIINNRNETIHFLKRVAQMKYQYESINDNCFIFILYLIRDNELSEVLWSNFDLKKIKNSISEIMKEMVDIRNISQYYNWFDVENECHILSKLIQKTNCLNKTHSDQSTYSQYMYFYFHESYMKIINDSSVGIIKNKQPVLPLNRFLENNDKNSDYENHRKKRKIIEIKPSDQRIVRITQLCEKEMEQIFSFVDDIKSKHSFCQWICVTLVCKEWFDIYINMFIRSFSGEKVKFNTGLSKFHRQLKYKCEQKIIQENRRIIKKNNLSLSKYLNNRQIIDVRKINE